MEVTTPTARRRSIPTSWRDPLVWWLGVAAFNSLTAVVRGVTTSTEAARWWASPDAQVPERTARWFLAGGNGTIFPGWQATDRGPLQPLLLLWGGHWSTNPVPAYFTGVVANSLWVVGLWWFLRAVGVDDRRIRWTVILVALTGSIWLNTVYPWPKVLAGALALGCAAAVLVDATIVRMMLVPSIMEILGDANWWFPKWLGFLPRLDIDGDSAPEPAAEPAREPVGSGV